MRQQTVFQAFALKKISKEPSDWSRAMHIITEFKWSYLLLTNQIVILSIGLKRKVLHLLRNVWHQMWHFLTLNFNVLESLERKSIIPEVLAMYFPVHGQLWCYCCEPKVRNMMVCTSGFCSVKKFHQACLHVRRIPKQCICPFCGKRTSKVISGEKIWKWWITW